MRTRSTGLSGWGAYAVRRGLGLLLSLSLLVVVTFLIVPLIPGDPAVAVAGADATSEQIDAIRADLKLDDPLWLRFIDYVGGLFVGDLGNSFAYGTSVATIIATKLPYTASLAGLGILVVLLVAIPLGVTVGVLTRGGRRRWLDVAFGTGTGFLQAIPPYVVATVLIIVFAIGARILPAAGAATPAALILPVIGISIGGVCGIARVVRRETATVLEQDFMRTARGRRLSGARLYTRHALPNLLTTALTLAGTILAGMLGGAITIETVFAWPGLGREIITAIVNKDYPVIQGVILVIGLLAILINIAVDVILGIVDPRTLGGK
ncbi:ABC transporter permease [Rathayibacter sp. SD072]|nr:ABC transporter permease [Rathayibacter sp. SD072]